MRCATLFSLALLSSVSAACGAEIGLFADADCSTNHMTVGAPEMATIYVSYRGNLRAPMFGAEFRIVGLPGDWFLLGVIPSPASTLVIGNPLGAGTNIAFPQTQPGDCVPLFTVHVVSTRIVSDLELEVRAHTTPSNPQFNCPFVIFDCGPACDWWGCVDGGRLFINTTVPNASLAWSAVKQLYR